MVGWTGRLRDVWGRTLSLSWPVMTEQLFNTLMRTTDIIVTGLFSPAAVAALGLADLYAQLSMRVGHGLGGGAIALSSQDTGGGAEASRDEAITQALLLGLLAGLPLAAFGLVFGRLGIALLGATPEVARLGGLYLAVVLAAAPADIVAIVGARSLQGTGDTRTPMYVNIAANVINIVGSVTLGLGVGPFPRLSILGVGLATAVANTFTAVVILLAIRSDRTVAGFARPAHPVVAYQLLAVSLPRLAEGLVTTLVYFPFNALLLLFGTEVTAAYHIGRRMYHQVTGPLYRAYNLTASIVVGQSLGRGDPDGARFDGWAVAVLSVLTLGVAGVVLFVAARPLVSLFTDDPATIGYAADFARTFGVTIVFIALFFSLSGSLQGAGDTRTPLIARITGFAGFFLGFSYLASVVLDWGVVGIYAGIVLTYAWMTAVVGYGFLRGDWEVRAAAMMDERREAAGRA